MAPSSVHLNSDRYPSVVILGAVFPNLLQTTKPIPAKGALSSPSPITWGNKDVTGIKDTAPLLSQQVEGSMVSAPGETRALYPSKREALLLSQGWEITAEQFCSLQQHPH